MEEIPVPLKPKFCKPCNQMRRIMDFYREQDGECKKCICAKKMAQYRKKNPQKAKWSKNWSRISMEY